MPTLKHPMEELEKITIDLCEIRLSGTLQDNLFAKSEDAEENQSAKVSDLQPSGLSLAIRHSLEGMTNDCFTVKCTLFAVESLNITVIPTHL
jgi:hypothetical protein